MASMTNLTETNLLKLIFQNVNFANIGDATGLRGSTSAGKLYLTLYTSDPGEDDTGTEATYTGYVRKSVDRSPAGWTVSGNQVSNTNDQSFVISSGGTNTITHLGIRTAASGGDLLFHVTLSSSVTINSGETPKFNASSITFTAD